MLENCFTDACNYNVFHSLLLNMNNKCGFTCARLDNNMMQHTMFVCLFRFHAIIPCFDSLLLVQKLCEFLLQSQKILSQLLGLHVPL